MFQKQNYQRFIKPVEGEVFDSEYDIASAVIQDPITRDTSPLVVTTIDLSVAGNRNLKIPGRAFVGYFFDNQSVNKERVVTGFVGVFINSNNTQPAVVPFPAKHNRGYRGSFTELYIEWPAQANVSVDFVILRSKYTPWMTDDINPSNVATLTWISEAPVGVIDGVNTVFTLSQAPADPNSLELYQDGIFQRPGIDYTLLGATITMTTPPALAQDLWAKYVGTNSGTISFASEQPAGVVNGVNTVFTLSTTPTDANSLGLFQDGIFQRPGIDYTLVNQTITMTTPPALAQELWAQYRDF